MYWEIFAIIFEGIVANIEVFAPGTGYTIANINAREMYGDNALAVNVTQFPVQIGDRYDGKDFWRDDRKIEYLPTDTERVIVLEAEHAVMNTALDDLAIAILED